MVDAVAVDCTAVEHARNPLMTPPCECPRCAPASPAADADDDGTSTIWIAVSGRPVRHDVQNMALGRTGHAALG